MVDQLGCLGTEDKLGDCSASEPFGTGVCGKSEMAGVFCGCKFITTMQSLWM